MPLNLMSIASEYACLISVSTNHSPFVEAGSVSEHQYNGSFCIVDYLICIPLSLVSIAYTCLISVSTNHSPFVEAGSVSEHQLNGSFCIGDHLMCIPLNLMSIASDYTCFH